MQPPPSSYPLALRLLPQGRAIMRPALVSSPGLIPSLLSTGIQHCLLDIKTFLLDIPTSMTSSYHMTALASSPRLTPSLSLNGIQHRLLDVMTSLLSTLTSVTSSCCRSWTPPQCRHWRHLFDIANSHRYPLLLITAWCPPPSCLQELRHRALQSFITCRNRWRRDSKPPIFRSPPLKVTTWSGLFVCLAAYGGDTTVTRFFSTHYNDELAASVQTAGFFYYVVFCLFWLWLDSRIWYYRTELNGDHSKAWEGVCFNVLTPILWRLIYTGILKPFLMYLDWRLVLVYRSLLTLCFALYLS